MSAYICTSYRQTDRQMDMQVEGGMDRQADRQMNGTQMDRQTDTYVSDRCDTLMMEYDQII